MHIFKMIKAAFLTIAILFVLMVSGLSAAEIETSPSSTGVEISTEELSQILLTGKIPVIDVRPEKEYSISHIPGSVSIFETEIDQMIKASPDKSNGPVLYCNGPHCHKTSRVAETLSKRGYTNIKKYQLGLPVWRAFGNAAETTLSGFKHIYSLDKTAVIVDARNKELYKAGSLKGAVNLQASEIEAANKDGRLPYTDHGTRVIIFGSSVQEARKLAEAVAQRAYWNSSYLSVTYEDLKSAF
jgi:rhodanese-related sulfurtransferase